MASTKNESGKGGIMEHFVLFLFHNMVYGNFIRKNIDWNNNTFYDLGLESHPALGLKRIEYCKPDIIFLDCEFPKMELSQYLSMIRNITNRFQVILIYTDSIAPQIDDPNIVEVIHSNEVSYSKISEILAKISTQFLKSQNTNFDNENEWEARSKQLKTALEEPETFSSFSFFKNVTGQKVFITIVIPDESIYNQVNIRRVFAQLLDMIIDKSSTYLFLSDANQYCLITADQVLCTTFSAVFIQTYGQHFYYVQPQKCFVKTLHNFYLIAKQIASLSYFEPEFSCITEKLISGPKKIPFSSIDSKLFELFTVITEGNQKKASQCIHDLYFKMAKPSYSWEFVHYLRRKLNTLFTLIMELQGSVQKSSLNFDIDYISLEEAQVNAQITVVLFSAPKLSRRINQLVLEAVYVIHNLYQEDISLNYVAQKINTSPSYLSTIFKNNLGINFNNYLISVRLSAAEGLLTQTALKKNDIAHRSGFNDARYFSKLFKKTKGLSPTDIRKKI
ncbi:MAG: helix-turn-helix domain-containing protein [Prevotella sp.]|nr:helix-turn-helix domain-containing protein [Prevotella sp.]